MPEISRFLGNIARLHYRHHAPPHFHVHYGDYKVTIEIELGVVNGRFPKRALSAVLEWHELNRSALLLDWHKAENRETLDTIPPFGIAMNFLHLTQAHHVSGHWLHVSFDDGFSGIVDLSTELDGPVFDPLWDIDFFRQTSLNGSTIEWPNGADFAPEYLHSLLNAASRSLATA